MKISDVEPGTCAEIQKVDIGQFTNQLEAIEELPAVDRSNLAVYLADKCMSCVSIQGETEVLQECDVLTGDESEICAIGVQRAVLMAVDTEAGFDIPTFVTSNQQLGSS